MRGGDAPYEVQIVVEALQEDLGQSRVALALERAKLHAALKEQDALRGRLADAEDELAQLRSAQPAPEVEPT